MGIMANSISCYRYETVGDLSKAKTLNQVQECLTKRRFDGWSGDAEETTGWVRFDDHNSTDFNEIDFDPYCMFSLRKDVRRVSSALLKNRMEKECNEWLSARPALRRVPVQRKAEIRESILSALLAQALPEPSTVDVLWDRARDIVTVASISARALDLVEQEFAATFEGLTLRPVHPMRRAEMVLPAEQVGRLKDMNLTTSDDVLVQIRNNRWIGRDFLSWLMYRTERYDSMYSVNHEGPVPYGSRFASYLDNRVVLVGDHEEGKRKSSILGPQGHFSEARKALQDGMSIAEATIHFNYTDFKWKMTVKGDSFAFGSFACPRVMIEKDEITDPASEAEAVFFERMHLMETGFQLFDSIFSTFLTDRINRDVWPDVFGEINAWIHEDEV